MCSNKPESRGALREKLLLRALVEPLESSAGGLGATARQTEQVSAGDKKKKKKKKKIFFFC